MELESWFHTNTFGEKFVYIRQARIPFFNVILCGLTQPNANYDVDFPAAGGGCPCTILDYTLSGSGTITDPTGTHILTAGQLVYIPKGTPVHFQADGKDPFKKLFLQMTGTVWPSWRTQFALPKDSILVRPCPVEMQMWEIANLLRTTTPANVLENMRRISVTVYDILSRFRQEETFGITEEKDTLPFQIRRSLEEHMYHEISVKDIAARLYITDSHCIRIFKKQFGITPMQYLTKIRMEQAQILLRETSIPIGEIARKLCFYDSQHFSTAFRQYTTLSPSEFRNAVK